MQSGAEATAIPAADFLARIKRAMAPAHRKLERGLGLSPRIVTEAQIRRAANETFSRLDGWLSAQEVEA